MKMKESCPGRRNVCKLVTNNTGMTNAAVMKPLPRLDPSS